MKRIIIILLSLIVVVGSLQAQTTKKKKKVKKTPVIEKPAEIPLPPRSSDCFFAVNLILDSAFGPTEPLQGFGYVNEIHKDAQTKNVFDAEHNSVWYKISCPYSGKLIIDITPRSEIDDYDFLVYKYTDKYFCNRVEKNRVKPIRSIMSVPNIDKKGATGLSLQGTLANISKSSNEAYGRYIDVKEGDVYILVLDNLQDGGLGHTIKAEIYTQHAPLYVQVVDSLAKQRTTADIHVKESTQDKELLNLSNTGSTKIKLLPHCEYDILITKNGYFNYTYHASYDRIAGTKDTILTARLAPIKVGSSISISGDLYFDVDDNDSVILMKESYGAIDQIVKILKDYPRIKIEIVGRINTDGLSLKNDNINSKKRADAIKNYMVMQGIPQDNILTRGSTTKELNAQIAEQNKKKTTIFPKCEIKIKSLE